MTDNIRKYVQNSASGFIKMVKNTCTKRGKSPLLTTAGQHLKNARGQRFSPCICAPQLAPGKPRQRRVEEPEVGEVAAEAVPRYCCVSPRVTSGPFAVSRPCKPLRLLCQNPNDVFLCCHGKKVMSEAAGIRLLPGICKSFWRDAHLPLPLLFQGSASQFLNSWLQKSARIHHTQPAPAFGCRELHQEGLRPASLPSATHKSALEAGDCRTRLRSPQLPLITCITSCFPSFLRKNNLPAHLLQVFTSRYREEKLCWCPPFYKTIPPTPYKTIS